MTKYYCYQVDPEYQESPLYRDYPESVCDVTVFGNRDYREWISSEITLIMKVLRNTSFQCDFDECKDNSERRKVLWEWFGNLPELSDEDLYALSDCIFNLDDPNQACFVFSRFIGKEYVWYEIRGCCQGEWNYIFWCKTDLPYFDHLKFEVEYFNTGSEWRVEDGDDNVVEWIYSTRWKMEDVREEIAMELGEAPDQIRLYEFDGYKRTPKYKECVFD